MYSHLNSHSQLVESIFGLIDKESGGKVPYKEVMNVKATVARMSARKPSVRDNAWRLQLADRKLDYYQVQCVLPDTSHDAPSEAYHAHAWMWVYVDMYDRHTCT